MAEGLEVDLVAAADRPRGRSPGMNYDADQEPRLRHLGEAAAQGLGGGSRPARIALAGEGGVEERHHPIAGYLSTIP